MDPANLDWGWGALKVDNIFPTVAGVARLAASPACPVSVLTRSALDFPGCGQLWCMEIFCCTGFHSDTRDRAPADPALADPGDLQDQYGLARQVCPQVT